RMRGAHDELVVHAGTVLGRDELPVAGEGRDHVQDGQAEPVARAIDEVAREPAGAASGVRGDQDLVGGEGAQLVLDREQRIGVARAAAVVGLSSIGLIHLLDIPGKFTDAPYMGWLYVGLIVGSVGVAAVLIERHDRRAWAAAAAVAVAPLVGYVLTRTVGLP